MSCSEELFLAVVALDVALPPLARRARRDGEWGLVASLNDLHDKCGWIIADYNRSRPGDEQLQLEVTALRARHTGHDDIA